VERKTKKLEKLQSDEEDLESKFEDLNIKMKTQGQQLFDNCCQKIAVSEA